MGRAIAVVLVGVIETVLGAKQQAKSNKYRGNPNQN
jgi:MFS superfamily sulfate permease-like transporter